MTDKWLTLDEYAEFHDISTRWVEKMIKKENLNEVKHRKIKKTLGKIVVEKRFNKATGRKCRMFKVNK